MRTKLVVAAGVAVVLAGCGTVGALDAPKATAPRTKTTSLVYRPAIDPTRFTARITNPYWPMARGTTWVYRGTKDGVAQREVVAVKRATRRIMGVRTVTVEDRVFSAGRLEERTTDWYAQDASGNVWYFGEASRDYERGRVRTRGSWRAGVEGAQPGIVVKADPRPGGPTYRQEWRAGVAEDMGRVVGVGAIAWVPAATYVGVLETLDTDGLNPGRREHKVYAPGVGLIHARSVGSGPAEELDLVSVRRPR
jgi:hypothetical protein